MTTENTKISPSLAYRLELHTEYPRTEKEFEDDIEDYTEREHYWTFAVQLTLIANGKPCIVMEHGVGPGGQLIPGKLENYNVDKIFQFENGKQMFVEIKTIPEYCRNFYTIKKFSMRQCVFQRGGIIVPRRRCWYYIPTDGIKHILKNYKAGIYPKFAPGSPAIRLYTGLDWNPLVRAGHIKEHNWSPDAVKFINENENILFRERKR